MPGRPSEAQRMMQPVSRVIGRLRRRLVDSHPVQTSKRIAELASLSIFEDIVCAPCTRRPPEPPAGMGARVARLHELSMIRFHLLLSAHASI